MKKITISLMLLIAASLAIQTSAQDDFTKG